MLGRAMQLRLLHLGARTLRYPVLTFCHDIFLRKPTWSLTTFEQCSVLLPRSFEPSSFAHFLPRSIALRFRYSSRITTRVSSPSAVAFRYFGQL